MELYQAIFHGVSTPSEIDILQVVKSCSTSVDRPRPVSGEVNSPRRSFTLHGEKARRRFHHSTDLNALSTYCERSLAFTQHDSTMAKPHGYKPDQALGIRGTPMLKLL